MASKYRCPTCGINDPDAYTRCNHPGCPDGRDPRPAFRDRSDRELAALRARVEKAEWERDDAIATTKLLQQQLKIQNDSFAARLSEATRRAVEAGGTVPQLVERLDGFAKAYPESVFPPPTKEDRDWLHETRPGLQDRIAADMGRHFAQFATEAAEALTRQQALLDEAAETVELCRKTMCVQMMLLGQDVEHSPFIADIDATLAKLKESRDA